MAKASDIVVNEVVCRHCGGKDAYVWRECAHCKGRGYCTDAEQNGQLTDGAGCEPCALCGGTKGWFECPNCGADLETWREN